jgi:hypothetical protein
MAGRVVVSSAAALFVAVAGTGLPSAVAASPVRPVPAAALAAVPDGASAGGAVIVVLKDQFLSRGLRALGPSRAAATNADQSSVLASIKAHGGSQVKQLVSVNAVAAHLPAAEVARLRSDAAVQEIIPDVEVPFLGDPVSAGAGADLTGRYSAQMVLNRKIPSQRLCPANPAKPLLEPEALSVTHTASDNPKDPDEAWKVATGKGVIVAIDGMNELAGNPNFIRADGSHVVLDAPKPYEDDGDDETYGDASSVAAQGTVTYDFSKELPYSHLPSGCTFRIFGLAPGASLVDTSNIPRYGSIDGDRAERLSQIIAGIDRVVMKVHANVISESYGSQFLGAINVLDKADDAAVAAGVTVVASSGDSGPSGTTVSPAMDPNVIAAGATDTLRLRAQADGYSNWTSNNMAALSSGGTSVNNKLVDLVAPGYEGEAACNPAAQGSGCPANAHTETMRGTSESAPLIAAGAADVIQAYSGTHGGARPTPALVKQILAGTAQDLGFPADQQGAGLMDVYAAVRAAQQEPGATSTVPSPDDSTSLVPSPSQLDLSGNGGTTTSQHVSLYNTGDTPARVTAAYRTFGAAKQIGPAVTEKVSAPNPARPVPAEGAQAAKPIKFTVPAGIDELNADIIIPDPANKTNVGITLVDPEGRLTQVSYSYDADFPGAAPAPDMQHVEVAHPMEGTWTAKLLWNAGDVDLQSPPAKPGSYRGNLSFRVTGVNYTTASAAKPVTIPAHSSVSVPLNVTFPDAPGDHPQSVQFTGSNGSQSSVPIARRTLIPSAGGSFSTLITSTVDRGVGQISTYNINVPAGKKDLDVSFHTADTSPDNAYTYYLVTPSGKVAAKSSTPSPAVNSAGSRGSAEDIAVNPVAGLWEIDIVLDGTVSGKEFTQTVYSTVKYNQASPDGA